MVQSFEMTVIKIRYVLGTLVFGPGEQSKRIAIKINDDDVFELDEHFYCKLTMARCVSDEKVKYYRVKIM